MPFCLSTAYLLGNSLRIPWALQERRDAWRMQQVSVGSYQQKAQLPDSCRMRDIYAAFHSQMLDRDENSVVIPAVLARLGPHTGDPVRCVDVFTAINTFRKAESVSHVGQWTLHPVNGPRFAVANSWR